MLTKRFFKTKDEVEVTFSVAAEGHGEAALVCDTNGWTAIDMKRSDRGKGPFRTKVRFAKDTQVEFRYLLDGETWENDEDADGYTDNNLGSSNSILLARP